MRKLKAILRRISGENGQALILAVLLMLAMGIILPPLLTYTTSGISMSQAAEVISNELYSADAGIEDAIWQINYDHLEETFTSPAYDAFDYYSTWSYDLSQPVNELDVSADIDNVWIPKDIVAPVPATARSLVETGKLIVAGTTIGSQDYEIKISYYPEAGESLAVEKIGIWLPRGFFYVTGSCNLEEDPGDDYYSVPVVEDHAGNRAVIWDFASVDFTDFPGVNPGDTPMTATISFRFISNQPGRTPQAVAWVETSGVADIPFSWDADVKVYKIISTAGDTEIEAYVIKGEMRQLGSAIGGDYSAIGNTLMIASGDPRYRDILLSESSTDASDIPTDADIQGAYLYWSAWVEDSIAAPGQSIFQDSCDDFDNWDRGGSWSLNGSEFTADGSGGDANRRLTLKDSLDLSAYAGKPVMVSWEQRETGWWDNDDYFYFAFSGDGGSSWSNNILAFYDDIGSSHRFFYYVIPQAYLTAGFKIRFFADSDSSSEDVYIHNIDIKELIFKDDCDDFGDWANGSNWSVAGGDYGSEFRGEGGDGSSTRELTMTDNLNLSAYSGSTVKVCFNARETGGWEGADRLYIAFSGNGGTTWSSNVEIFRNDIGDKPGGFTEEIPDEYLTDDFLMRFYTSANWFDEVVYIDNIGIYEFLSFLYDDTAVFKIDGEQVYFDAGGDPQQGAEVLTADSWQVINNMDYGNPHGYSYACYKDVTNLLRAFCAEGDDGHYPGNGTYTVGDVYGQANGDEWAYAGWSLIIIYSSPDTEGHQLYLYDIFLYCDHYTNLDFDQDGEPGGTLSGFLVPDPIVGEVYAAKLACFIGEGDDVYNGDFIALNDSKLSNSASPQDDVWNGKSPGFAAEGVDVDTFDITWASGILSPGDTKAQIDIDTDIDIWNLVYIIISFRSETTTGGAISYLIRR